MKASRFSDAQKAFILKQATDGMPVADNRYWMKVQWQVKQNQTQA
jgi:hypothetical protein